MRRLVAQTVDMYRGGFDSRRMLLQQSLGTPEGGLSPFVALMQQNTRLIILTLEVGRTPNANGNLSSMCCSSRWARPRAAGARSSR